jgi:hypothetical protein
MKGRPRGAKVYLNHRCTLFENLVFAKFPGGGRVYSGVVNILGGKYTFLGVDYAFIYKLCKNFGERVHFYAPLSPLQCCSEFEKKNLT